ncbi:hypothetical protein BUALT_Bualt10G0014400 [Buddleja alternifolia]|uniref:VQ domain-containing protein n=1 Tax=Buddleja alternifolia TaxID=168488 RepID=A0AAV6X5Y0_9LAMI|nr:hypothetical protein BUALT_Bualt10G0014400 [Buddleja alternifolia]
MDSSNQQSMNRQQVDLPLGVNKSGKIITKKSPFHQPNFATTSRQQQPQPQPRVYNINKTDFRNIVQQLTGSSSREPQRPTPHLQNHPTTTPNNNNRLHRVRPPPLAPPTQPQLPHLHISLQQPYPNAFTAPPPPPSQYDQLSPPVFLPSTPSDIWTNTTQSPISGYMLYLQNSAIDLGPGQSHSGPPPPALPSQPITNCPPPVLPSPTSLFLLPSPTGFLNLFSPRSPYPLISPNFSFGPRGTLGPGPPHPPPSPGYGFPSSPSGLFPISSPRWRNQ